MIIETPSKLKIKTNTHVNLYISEKISIIMLSLVLSVTSFCICFLPFPSLQGSSFNPFFSSAFQLLLKNKGAAPSVWLSGCA